MRKKGLNGRIIYCDFSVSFNIENKWKCIGIWDIIETKNCFKILDRLVIQTIKSIFYDWLEVGDINLSGVYVDKYTSKLHIVRMT